MLRRITACLNAIAIALVSLAPFTVTSAKVHAQTAELGTVSKIAPELQQTLGSTGSAAPTGVGGATTGGAAQGQGQTGQSQRVRIVVQTTGRPTVEQRQAIESAEGQISQSYEALNALVVDVPRRSLGSLATPVPWPLRSPGGWSPAKLTAARMRDLFLFLLKSA